MYKNVYFVYKRRNHDHYNNFNFPRRSFLETTYVVAISGMGPTFSTQFFVESYTFSSNYTTWVLLTSRPHMWSLHSFHFVLIKLIRRMLKNKRVLRCKILCHRNCSRYFKIFSKNHLIIY